MTIKIGINGFGRMGRLVLRAGWDHEHIEFVQINDPAGDAQTFAHLLNFDSIHGRWRHEAKAIGSQIQIEQRSLGFSQNVAISDTDWSQCDLVIEASGKFKTADQLASFLGQGVHKVLVTAPVKDSSVLNIVMGVNQHLYQYDKHAIVTAASCTTNCMAPVIKVIEQEIGIEHGSMTTIHNLTNTQSLLDQPHSDLRRSRASGMSLIPTTTGSAKAITDIFPSLTGRLNGHAVRVPLANASLTDMVLELKRDTDAEEVNHLLKLASENELSGILGYETRPLVSMDYKTDPRSAIIDALSTMVINQRQLKLYAWYDNEWGYVNRVVELACLITEPVVD